MTGAAFLPCDGRQGNEKCRGGASYQGPLHGGMIPDWLHTLSTEGWYIGHKVAYCPRCSQDRGWTEKYFKSEVKFYELTGDTLI